MEQIWSNDILWSIKMSSMQQLSWNTLWSRAAVNANS